MKIMGEAKVSLHLTDMDKQEVNHLYYALLNIREIDLSEDEKAAWKKLTRAVGKWRSIYKVILQLKYGVTCEFAAKVCVYLREGVWAIIAAQEKTVEVAVFEESLFNFIQ